MTNAKWASADANGGWRNQYRQMLRWRDRALASLNRGNSIDCLDFSLAFFVWCYSLRDWLKEDGARSEKQLQDLIQNQASWKYCRDIALRVKHFAPVSPSIDSEFGISREYDWFTAQFRGTERSDWNLWIDGNKLRLAQIIGDLSEMWVQELCEDFKAQQ